jgi:hypothetical protein
LIRSALSEMIASLFTLRTGQQFWDAIKPFRLIYADGTLQPFHHGEAGDGCTIHWFMDRELLRSLMFCATTRHNRATLPSVDSLARLSFVTFKTKLR